MHSRQKHNPLNNKHAHERINPSAKLVREAAKQANAQRRMARYERLNGKRAISKDEKKVIKDRKANSRKWINNVGSYIQTISKMATEEHINNQKLERQIE